MIHIGIDPGLTGAIAVINKNGVPLIFDAPILLIKGTKKDHRIIDANAAARLLRPFSPVLSSEEPAHCFIEKIVAMPRSYRDKNGIEHQTKMGAVSMINYGVGYGIWIGILAALNIPYTEVHPVTWKSKIMAGMGKEKDASIARAKQLYPTADLSLKKHHGRADALLIAHFGRSIS